ncbi:MAG: hypothetical protein IT350_06435 [Deltaproteobacteria bacterium]|nr:hypothetical protein [Deltaproteobacteria bacterium]
MKWVSSWTAFGAAVFFAAALAIAACESGGSGDDDDDDYQGDGTLGGEIMEACAEFFAECYDLSEASAAANYCDFLDQYLDLGPCYDKALRDFLGCVIDGFDCDTHDPAGITPCQDSLGADLADCGGPVDDDADDDASDDDDDSDDDDADDDDDDSDDDSDDDADDDADDDSSGSAPVLSGGGWDPDPAVDDGSGDIVSTLSWQVCDVDDDLSGGQIFIWFTGTSEPAIVDDVFWDEFGGGAPSAPNCGSPLTVGITVDFTSIVPWGDDNCVDVEATDGEGNMSNKLVNLCVYVP